MITILHVVGARPNYMKVAPLIDCLRGVRDVRSVLVDTGQHYDESMSDVFLRELGLPKPDHNLEVGSCSHAVQTARTMIGIEQVCELERPSIVVVVGDVNSTLAAALVASKMRIPIAHVESGLRSFDRSMPEEINRVVIDQLADLLLTSSPEAAANLQREGIPDSRIRFVGNIMIDSLLRYLPRADFDRIRDRIGVPAGSYAVLTLHRPSNVDDPETFESIAGAIKEISAELPVVFPVHPRTRARMEGGVIARCFERTVTTEPLGYMDFLSLLAHSRLVLTDSGGVQEETTILRIPCLTLRRNTERPITISHGTNRLVGTEVEGIVAGYREAIARPPIERAPDLWDGRTAPRIAREILARIGL